MRKSICACLLWVIGVLASAHAGQCAATEMEESHTHEATFLVPTQNLYFDNDEMLVVVGEHSFPVKALERSGNQWKVRVVSAGYCQLGHNLCGGCSMCHKPGCIYYIRPCKLWN